MEQEDSGAIAIVAMECRVPQADDVDALWELLLQGRCAITELRDEQVAAAGVPEAQRSRLNYVKRAGVLEDIDKFDAAYFDMGSREADVLDPQQRMMLEATVKLLNRGNVDPSRTDRRIAVFAGAAFSTYLFGVLERADLVDALGEMLVRHANDREFLPTRLSYKLNLDGPSVNVQSACSTGLVAVHLAAQSLLLGECDLAIAGAAYVKVPQHTGYLYQEDGMLSPDGLCRPFDAAASGTNFTNGLGLVLLKRLPDAVADGDDIVAVIAGSAINNDGSMKVSFTAPSVRGQVAALRSALEISGVDPAEVQYIEAHGTATALGDPIEVEAIKQAYGTTGRRCGIGSLKSNFGHLNIAAGIIGLIKAALVLKHKIVPATIHVERVSPQLDLQGSRFYVTNRTVELDTSAPRYAAVSAFGVGGTNSHVILRSHEAASPSPARQDGRPQLFTFSAKSEEALNRMAARYAEHFGADPTASFADAAFTARVGRPLLPVRAALVASDSREAAAKIREGDFRRHAGASAFPIAFSFAGQATQDPRVGQELARHCEPFERNLEAALHALRGPLALDPSACLWQRQRPVAIDSTLFEQPLTFALEYAAGCALLEAGLSPRCLIGLGVGEVVAAALSGVLDLQTAAAIVARRAQLLVECELGGQLSPKVRSAASGLLDHMGTIPFGTARIPIVSSVTGQALTESEYRSPSFWVAHVQPASRPASSTGTVRELGVRHLVEVGGGSLVRATLAGEEVGSAPMARSPRGGEGEYASFLDAIGLAWTLTPDVPIDRYTSGTRKVALPVYPFSRTSHWVEPVIGFRSRSGATAEGSQSAASPRPISGAAQGPAEGTDAGAGPNVPNGVVGDTVEPIIAGIYATFLGDDGLHRDLSFFELGGNSLVAIRMVNKLRETFKVDIPLRDFLRSSSIAAVSSQITNKLLELRS